MVYIKKPVWITLTAAIISILLVGTVFAVWSQNSEVKFNLTISAPDDSSGYCTDNVQYKTITEGITLLRDNIYNCIYTRMVKYDQKLDARIAELSSLPFGGITYQQLQDECSQYRNVDIARFGTDINKYGDLINQLSNFYNNSSQKDKDAVPDFWTQQHGLWDLHDKLWNQREDLFDVVNHLWDVGHSKIDYNNGGKKN